MADAPPKKSSTQFEDFMFVLLAIVLVSSFIQRAPQFFQEKTGLDVGSPYLTASAALTADTPVGTRVSTVNDGGYYESTALNANEVGTFPAGSVLVIRGGPETRVGGGRWWYVEEVTTGQEGWVPESMLVREGAGGVDANTRLGTKARAIMAVTLWRLPGSPERVGDMAKGTFGVVADGPREHRGARWWFFDQDESDEDGWVPESALAIASDTGWVAGSRVRATQDADLFERAGGGRALGSVREKDQLRVIGGPLLVGGAYWWLVESAEGTQGWMPERSLEEGGVRGWAKGVIATVLTIAVVVTVLLLGGIVYATVRTSQIRAQEAKRLREALPKTIKPLRNERWEKVLAHVQSDNPSDWRLAILEADIILDELVTGLGHRGTTLGDKLKQAHPGDFRTLNSAWEAHRVRNQIAHEGSDFVLTKREAQRVIGLYEQVLDEFKYS